MWSAIAFHLFRFFSAKDTKHKQNAKAQKKFAYQKLGARGEDKTAVQL